MTRSIVLNILSTKTIKFMLVSFVFSILFAVAMPTPAHAALTNAQIQGILSVLKAFGADQETINEVSEALNGGSSQSTSNSTSQSSSAPFLSLSTSNSEYEVGDSIPFRFSIKNAPAGAQVEVQAKLVQAQSPFTGSNSELGWQSPRVPQGASNGVRYQNTGSGTVDKSGVYEVRAFLIDCGSQGCQSKYNTNLNFGQPSREAYATASTFRITLTDKGESEDESSEETVNFTVTPLSGSAPLMAKFSASGLTSSNQYSIDFGDNKSESVGCSAATIYPAACFTNTHIYETPGTYNASLYKHGVPSCGGCSDLAGKEKIATTKVVVTSVRTNTNASSTSPCIPGPTNKCANPNTPSTPSDETPESEPAVQAPKPTVTLSVSPDTVKFGKRATLTWKSTNATSCTLSYGSTYENIATAGTKKVTPSASENSFIVSCTNASGASASNVVSVQVIYPKPTCTLLASKTLVEKGESITLSWTSKDATSASKTGTKNVAKGSVKVKINDQMLYKKTFIGPGGTVTCISKINIRGYGSWILENAKEQTVMAPGSTVLGDSTEALTDNQNHALMALVAAFGGSASR